MKKIGLKAINNIS